MLAHAEVELLKRGVGKLALVRELWSAFWMLLAASGEGKKD